MDNKTQAFLRELEMDEKQRQAIPFTEKAKGYLDNRNVVAAILGFIVLFMLAMTAPPFLTNKKDGGVNIIFAALIALASAFFYLRLENRKISNQSSSSSSSQHNIPLSAPLTHQKNGLPQPEQISG